MRAAAFALLAAAARARRSSTRSPRAPLLRGPPVPRRAVTWTSPSSRRCRCSRSRWGARCTLGRSGGTRTSCSRCAATCTRSCSSRPVLIRLNEAAHSATTCKRGGRINQQEITPMVDTPQGGVPSADVAPMGITVKYKGGEADGGAEFAGRPTRRGSASSATRSRRTRGSRRCLRGVELRWIIEPSAAAACPLPLASGTATCDPGATRHGWAMVLRPRVQRGRAQTTAATARAATARSTARRGAAAPRVRALYGAPPPPPPPRITQRARALDPIRRLFPPAVLGGRRHVRRGVQRGGCNYDGVDCYNAKYNTSMCAWTARARGSPTASVMPA